MSLASEVSALATRLAAEINALRAEKVSSTSVTEIVAITRAAYDALSSPDPTTLYVIKEG